MSDLIPYLSGIFISFLTFVLALASPGPNVLAVISASINQGRKDAYLVALGIALGSLTWSLTSIFGLSILILKYEYALLFIKIFGGCFLLYLAYQLFITSRKRFDLVAGLDVNMNKIKMVGKGYLIMLTNPKAPLAWIAIVSLGLKEGAPLFVGFIIAFGTFIISVIVHFLYAYLFTTQTMLLLFSKNRQKIQLTLSAIFLLAGVSLLLF